MQRAAAADVGNSSQFLRDGARHHSPGRARRAQAHRCRSGGAASHRSPLFEQPADLNALVHSLEVAIEIMESAAFAKWRKRTVWPQAKTCAERIHWVRQTCETYHHQAGTCKMGIDAMSVVDPQLRVYGIEGLRVADASIMPTVVSGNTNGPSIMIGEKAADLIRERKALALNAA